MKRPKELMICGKKCKVKYVSSAGGGEVDLNTGDITIGTSVPGDVFETLMHEICEYILYVQGCRYTRYEEGNDGLRFVLSHKEYETFAREVSLVVEQLLRK